MQRRYVPLTEDPRDEASDYRIEHLGGFKKHSHDDALFGLNQNDRALNPGWWILPSFVVGGLIWVFIFQLVISWL